MTRNPHDTGVKDKNGEPIFEGDRVRYWLEGSHTRWEYWNPEYVVEWQPPKFGLQHVGGGKDNGAHDFILRAGGGNGKLEIIVKNYGARVDWRADEINRLVAELQEARRVVARVGEENEKLKSYTQAQPFANASRFALGDRVTKLRGSSWTGAVVGFYSTKLTPHGVCVESENEPGSVQIYPDEAMNALSRKFSIKDIKV